MLLFNICRFNDIRNQKPQWAKYRWQNIGWYFYEAMATGWLWGAKPLARKIKTLRVSSICYSTLNSKEQWRACTNPMHALHDSSICPNMEK